MKKDETLLEILKRHEGFENYPYKCSAGHLTIGYGRNLESNGISENEAEILLIHDIEKATKEIQDLFPDFIKISSKRRMALTNMIFNLGRAGFLTFRKMISAILNENWQTAADEAKDSKWYKQVGERGIEIVSILRTNKNYVRFPNEGREND